MLVCFSHEASYFHAQKKREHKQDAEIFRLQSEVIEGLFHWNIEEVAKSRLLFEHSKNGFLEALNAQKSPVVGFYLPPTDIEMVMSLAQEGKRMPQKSTFFYPKLASGLVTYELDF